MRSWFVKKAYFAFVGKILKIFLIGSNCYSGNISTVERKVKDGNKNKITCLDSMMFYKGCMGDVGHADKMISAVGQKKSDEERKAFK